MAFLKGGAGANHAPSHPDSRWGEGSYERGDSRLLHPADRTAARVPAPTYSPDYNPLEKLWKKIKQHDTHLHYFPTFEALTKKVEQALLTFAKAPEEILALCGLPTELAKAA